MRNLPAVLTLAALLSSVITVALSAPLQLPPFEAGETITYTANEHVHNTQAGARFIESSQNIKFDIEVLRVTQKGAHIAFILRDWTASGDYDSGGRFYAAFKDVPIEVDVDASGIPLKITNFDDLKGHLFASSLSDHAHEMMQNGGVEFQKAEVALLFSPVLLKIAAMQPREPIAYGHSVLDSPVEDPPPSSGLKILVARSIDLLGVDPRQCSARIARKTAQTIQLQGKDQSSSVLETRADVSTADGWVVSLHEISGGTPEFVRTTDIHRLTRNPCSNGAPNK